MIRKTSEAYKHHVFAFTYGPFNKMFEAVFDLLIPLFMKAIIDLSKYETADKIPNVLSRGIAEFIVLLGEWVPGNAYLSYALSGGTMILVMGVIGFGLTMITQYIAARTAMEVGTEVRDSLYQKILSLSRKEKEQIGNNKLLTILNSDSYQVQQGVLIFIRLIVRAPFVIIGALVISLILNWQIGLIFLAIIPLILIVIFYIMGRSSKEYVGIQSKLDSLSTEASDTLDGAKVIKAFDSQEYEDKKFASATADYQKAAVHVQKLNALINPLTFAITAIATVLVVLFGGLPIMADTTNVNDANNSTIIITEVAYLAQIFTTLVQLTNVVLVLTKAEVSRKRVDSVLAIEPAIHDSKDAKAESIKRGDEIIAFHHVDLGYKDGGNLALSDIEFTLNKGDSLGIIGGTGSGKSTIVNLMERFLDATGGEVDYKGKNIKDYPLKDLRKEIGYVPQKSVLFKGTIKSNLKMSDPQASDEDMTKALKISCGYEFVSKYPDYLDHEVEEGGKNFSGGQRQRLCLARGFVKKPEVIILDDSTSALDLLTDKQVRTNISTEFPDVTKVIISQRVSTVSDCKLILVLDGGKVIGQGTHEELMKNCPVYIETYESQTRKEAN